METYLSNSLDSSLINNRDLNSNPEENITYSKSDNEFNINSLYKEESKEEDLYNDNPIFNIDTLQSLRISYSLEKSKNSQSLIDIINGGKYNSNEKENNKNDYNINIPNKKNTNNIYEKERNKFNINKMSYNNNSKKKNSNISNNKNKNNSFKNINNNKTSAMTKNSVINKKNISLNNNNKCNAFSLNNTNNNTGNSSYKIKIEEIFKERFEEKIKPKTNKLNKKKEELNGSDKNNEDETLEHKNICYTIKHCPKNTNNQLINDKNPNKNEKKKNDISNRNSPQKRKEFIFAYADEIQDYSIENVDDSDEKVKAKNNNNNKLKNEKKNELIIGMFGGHMDSSEDEENKNIMISELDIEISDSTEKKNKTKELSNKKIKLNNMILEKAIETSLKKGIFNSYNNSKQSHSVKNKKNIINNGKNLYFNYCNNKPKKINGNISKKSTKFKKIIKRAIYPLKKISSCYNIKKSDTTKNREEFHYNFENFLKMYKNSSSSIKFSNNYICKNITDLKNLSNNSGSNASSILALNTSTNNKNNKYIIKKIIKTDEINKRIQSPYYSKSNPNERKTKKYYKNNHSKKINNSLSKDLNNIALNRNTNKFLKSISTTWYNSNNISYKEPLSMNIPKIISINSNNKNYTLKNNTHYKSTYFNNNSKINNCYSVRTSSFNNHINNKNSLNKNENNYIKIKKKNDIPICNINKNKIPFKKKLMKNSELYTNNIKLKNILNSDNSITNRANSHQNQNRKNILNNPNYNFKFENAISILSKNNKNKNSLKSIYNSYANNINSKINKSNISHINKNINYKNGHYLNSSSLLINNKRNNDINIVNKFKKLDNNKFKENFQLLTEVNSIKKKYPYITKLIKNIINNKCKNDKIKKNLVYDKIISKNYLKNASKKNKITNLYSFKTNYFNEQKYKNNNILSIIHNKKYINNNNNKASLSYRIRIKNNIKNTTIMGPKHFAF